MPTSRYIGHLDADAFYVSAERVRDGYLLGKPVGVLGNQGACVIAKSYEMKKAGVKTGMPIWEAVALCPQGIYIKRDFHWYEALSRKLLQFMQEQLPRVEYYSIDEFFFEAWPAPGLTLQQLAEQLRDRIWHTLEIPVTVGIGRSKTLAKLFSDTAKPFGAIAVVDLELERTLLAQLAVNEISGIAARRAARLAPLGIHTCLDYALADRRLLREELTIVGEGLWYELNGEQIQPLHTRRPPHKALARGGSIGAATTDPWRVYAWLVRSLERLIEELEYHLVQPGRLSVSVCYRPDRVATGAVKLAAPSARFDILLEAAKRALRQAWVPNLPVTRLHLIADQLQMQGATQLGLFEPPAGKALALAQAKREVNARVGRFAVRSGATLFYNEVYHDEASDYDICDVRGKICF